MNNNHTYHVQPPPPLDLRPMLGDIWLQTHFDSGKCAKDAGVDEQVILKMFRKYPVARSDAEKVLIALSKMLQQDYSLETVKVFLARK